MYLRICLEAGLDLNANNPITCLPFSFKGSFDTNFAKGKLQHGEADLLGLVD